MWMASCNRSGLDNSSLLLNADRNEAATTSAILRRPVAPRLPALGVLVCAIGQGGWTYIGPVIAVDADAGAYTILPVAANPILDKLKALGLA